MAVASRAARAAELDLKAEEEEKWGTTRQQRLRQQQPTVRSRKGLVFAFLVGICCKSGLDQFLGTTNALRLLLQNATTEQQQVSPKEVLLSRQQLDPEELKRAAQHLNAAISLLSSSKTTTTEQKEAAAPPPPQRSEDHPVFAAVPDRSHLPYAWLWHPLTSQCLIMNTTTSIPDVFPPDFDPQLYEQANRHANKVPPEIVLDINHYNQIGRGDGWLASRGQGIRDILNKELVPQLPGLKLELGPFLNPLLYNGNDDIKYFDVLDLAGLKARAAEIDYPIRREVEIDYVHPSGDITSIPTDQNFSLVVSCHVVEHQLDLVRHLNAVSNLLQPGGYYTLMVPDKRYCFDHHIPATTIAQVLDDYYNHRYRAAKSHKFSSVIEHRALTVPDNVPASEYWKHKNDALPNFPITDLIDRIQLATLEYEQAAKAAKYIDVHNYQFTPQSLAHIVDTLHLLDLTPLRVHRVYETGYNHLEFGIVLKKCSSNDAKVD